MARADDPQDDKTMRMPRPDLAFDDDQTMRMPLPDWADEQTIRVPRPIADDDKTIRMPRRDLGDEKTIRVQRPQDDWEPTVRAPLAGLHNPGMVVLPLDDPRHEPTIRMPRPGSQATATSQAAWPPAAPAPHAVVPGALREMPKLPPAPPPSRKLLWVGLGVLGLVLAAVAWMVIRG